MRKQNGALTEWLGSGLQNRPQQFESAGHLIKKAMMKRFSSSLFLFYNSTIKNLAHPIFSGRKNIMHKF